MFTGECGLDGPIGREREGGRKGGRRVSNDSVQCVCLWAIYVHDTTHSTGLMESLHFNRHNKHTHTQV